MAQIPTACGNCGGALTLDRKIEGDDDRPEQRVYLCDSCGHQHEVIKFKGKALTKRSTDGAQ